MPQPNGGALLAGGVPGNRGGTGRPKSEVRAAALAGADEAIPILRAILKNGKARKAERIAAGRELLKYGLGLQREVSMDEVRERLSRTIALLWEELPAGDAERILGRLRPIWQ